MKSQIQLSTTDYAVLASLTLCPMSGYQMREFIAQSIGNFWNESFGQLYPALKHLAAAKLVRSAETPTGKRPKKVYAITPAGQRAVRTWLAQAAFPQPPRSELLLKIFFADQLSPVALTAHIDRLRQQSEALTQRYRNIALSLKREHAHDPRLPYWLATVRFGELRAQADLTWCAEMRKSLPGKNSKQKKESL